MEQFDSNKEIFEKFKINLREVMNNVMSPLESKVIQGSRSKSEISLTVAVFRVLSQFQVTYGSLDMITDGPTSVDYASYLLESWITESYSHVVRLT